MNRSVTNFYAQKFFKENADGFEQKKATRKQNFSNRRKRNFGLIKPSWKPSEKPASLGAKDLEGFDKIYKEICELGNCNERTFRNFVRSYKDSIRPQDYAGNASPDTDVIEDIYKHFKELAWKPEGPVALGKDDLAGVEKIYKAICKLDKNCKEDEFTNFVRSHKTIIRPQDYADRLEPSKDHIQEIHEHFVSQKNFSRYARRPVRNFANPEEVKTKQLKKAGGRKAADKAFVDGYIEGIKARQKSNNGEQLNQQAQEFWKGKLSDKDADKFLSKALDAYRILKEKSQKTFSRRPIPKKNFNSSVKIARKYFSGDNLQPTQTWTMPEINEKFLDKYLKYLEDHPFDVSREAIKPFWDIVVTPLLEECNLKPGMGGLPASLFLAWGLDSGYIRDLPSFLKAKENFVSIKPIFMQFAQKLGEGLLNMGQCKPSDETWRDALYQYWFR